MINRLKVDGVIVDKIEQIKSNFVRYYEKLYEAGKEREFEIDKYLNENWKVKIGEGELRGLNVPIAKKELIQALKKSKNGKLPGSDRLPAIYYKKMEEVYNILLDVMNLILKGGPKPA